MKIHTAGFQKIASLVKCIEIRHVYMLNIHMLIVNNVNKKFAFSLSGYPNECFFKYLYD